MVDPVGLLVGVLLVGVGVVGIRYAERITRLEERIDAIGSRRSLDGVEPARWNVALTKAFAAGAGLFGGFVLLLALLS